MRKPFTAKKLSVFIVAAAVLVLIGFWAKGAYEKHQLTQRLLEEEIYMFQDTYMFHHFDRGSSIIYAYYMVCEPVDDRARLVEKLERLMEEKRVVQGVRDYYREKFGEEFGYDDLLISVKFYKPSREFPIGWQPLELYDMEDYPEISPNLFVSIHVPWSSESEDDHTYLFWRPDTPFSNLTHDTFKRQPQADGSYILVPKD